MNNDLKFFFKDIVKLNPTLALDIGFKSKYIFSHIENDISNEYIEDFKKILNKYKNTKNISLKYIVNIYLKMLKYPFILLPIYSLDNPIIEFDYMNGSIYPKNKAYLKSRIEDFDKLLETSIIRMKEGMKKNITIPKIICKKIIKDLSKPIYINRYKKFINFLKKDYLKKCRKKIGLYALKDGKKMYQLLIDINCSFHIKAPEIHKIGLIETNKLYKKLINIKYENKEHCKSKKELLNLYKSHYNYINKNILHKYFKYIPKTVCKIKPVPENLEKSSPFAYYYPLVDTFFINTYDLKSMSKEDMFTLTMHESIPGHHYQYAYMKEHNLPKYKQYAIDNNALAEGWALYTETLGPETKGSIRAQLFRSVRLVIDTGIHYYGWSFKKAFNYMKKYVGYSDEEIKSEIYRYICIPGQAVSYYLGKIYILKLRDLYINKYKLGDIKDFHEFILEDGFITFDHLMKKLKKMI